jgi:hypothetical protein
MADMAEKIAAREPQRNLNFWLRKMLNQPSRSLAAWKQLGNSGS